MGEVVLEEHQSPGPLLRCDSPGVAELWTQLRTKLARQLVGAADQAKAEVESQAAAD